MLGPSGSGKSSLVRAGVVPRVTRASDVLVRSIHSLDRPLAALEHAVDGELREGEPFAASAMVTRLLRHGPWERLLLVIDPFEPVFMRPSDVEREQFFRALTVLRRVPSCSMILTVQANFYGEVMGSPLWPLGPGEEFDLLPPDLAGLREAIIRPAAAVGVYVDPVLVERLVTDAGPPREDPSLPLLQQTLALLWERRRRRLIQLHAYENLGSHAAPGITAAVATMPKVVLSTLGPVGLEVAQRIRVRLVDIRDAVGERGGSGVSVRKARVLRRLQPIDALRGGPGYDSQLFAHVCGIWRRPADHPQPSRAGRHSDG